MSLNSQYKKGVLDLCVLSMVSSADCYGYDISETLVKVIDISDGAVYPVLRKLKQQGLVTTYLSESSGGPPRKYYALTRLGKEEYYTAREEWLQFVDEVNSLLNGEDKR